MKKTRLVITVACICLTFALSSFAFADENRNSFNETNFLQTIDTTLKSQGVEKSAEVELNRQQLEFTNYTVVVDNTELTEIQLPVTDNKLVFSKDSADIGEFSFGVYLPFKNANLQIKNNTALYVGSDETINHALRVIDHYVQSYTTVDSIDDQTEFSYALELPENGYMKYAERNGHVDGVLLYKTDYAQDEAVSRYIGFLAPSMAIDANGNEVAVTFEIIDDTVLHTVIVDENTAFPVTSSITIAAAANFSDYYTGYSWPLRSFYREPPNGDGSFLRQDYSLQLLPKTNVIYPPPGIDPYIAWEVVVNHVPPHREWYNQDRLLAQWWCHFDFASHKDDWNLEPWRPKVSSTVMFQYRCNPY